MMPAPVVIFAYKRPIHLARTLEALKNNRLIDKTEVYFFADGSKGEADIDDVNETRRVISDFCDQNICYKSHIHESEKNMGLASSVINGVTQVFKIHDRVIVLEDDILTTADFLQFMNDGLDFFKGDPKVGAISGYVPDMSFPRNYTSDIFYSLRGNSWGWATWKDIWDDTDWNVKDFNIYVHSKKLMNGFEKTQRGASQMLIDQMNGKLDSWAIRWDYSFFRRNLYTIYPVSTRVYNIGFDGSGTHCTKDDEHIDETYDLSGLTYKMSKIKPKRELLRRSSGNSLLDIIRLTL